MRIPKPRLNDWPRIGSRLCNKIPYPPTTASFLDLITDGTMPAGKSFSGFQKLYTPAPKG